MSSAASELVPKGDAAWNPTVPQGHTSYTWFKKSAVSAVATDGKKKNTTKKARKEAMAAGIVVNKAVVVERKKREELTAESKEVRLPVSNKRNILITSALPYVNNVPHLGNIIGCVLSADVYARFGRQRGHNVVYVCGTDEYGTATETKAIEAKMTPQQICDKYHAIHRDIYKWFDIKFDKFGRTTTPQQTTIAQDIYQHIEDNKYVLIDDVNQLYCPGCARYLADRFVEGTCPKPDCGYSDARGDQCDKCGSLLNAEELIEPKCKLCKQCPENKTSQHLFLDLPKLSDELHAWVDKAAAKGKWSSNAIVITKSWIRDGLKPRCISRDLKWGTPVPKEGFTDKVFYVWFDAPIGYVSITANYTDEWKQWWMNPENVELYQFMGKDNIPFHTVIFPSSLLATKQNYTMLHHISTTEYLQYCGGKFSKSRGTGVFGDDAKNTNIPSEVWRYYLLINRPEGSDTVFTWEDFAAKNNTELVNNLGNFIQRCSSLAFNAFEGKVPACDNAAMQDADKAFIQAITDSLHKYVELLEAVQIKDALKEMMALSRHANTYLQETKPWELLKQPATKARGETVLHVCLNAVCFLAIMMEPYMPSITAEICDMLKWQLPVEALADGKLHYKSYLEPGHAFNKPEPLFRRIEEAERKELSSRYGGEVSMAGEKFPLNLVVGRVEDVKDHPDATYPAYVLTVDLGEEKQVEEKAAANSKAPAKKVTVGGKRTIVSALRSSYTKEELTGKNVIVLTNTKDANFRGVKSQGMVLTAVKDNATVVLTSDEKPGSLALPQGTWSDPAKAFDVKKELQKLSLQTRDKGHAFFGDLPIFVNEKPLVADKGVEKALIK